MKSEIIGGKIRAARELKGLTIIEAATDIGISYTFLRNMELGDSHIPIKWLVKMSDYFEVDFIQNLYQQTKKFKKPLKHPENIRSLPY